MEKYVRNFEIIGNKLKLYIKRPIGILTKQIFNYFKTRYGNNYENYLGESLDITGKYVILTFVLRSTEELRVYIDNK